nr:MAG TPA: hypothetical protein [Caudoviricetes sp.]
MDILGKVIGVFRRKERISGRHISRPCMNWNAR